jgi:hypothetical protein
MGTAPGGRLATIGQCLSARVSCGGDLSPHRRTRRALPHLSYGSRTSYGCQSHQVIGTFKERDGTRVAAQLTYIKLANRHEWYVACVRVPGSQAD